jgi:hypothetical protein
VFCFDLDNVICKTKLNNYKNSKPIAVNIKYINQLFEKGFVIKIFTARYMGRTNDNETRARALAYKLTMNQLKKWNVKYNKLIFGKPSYDIFVDDKAFGFSKNWVKIFSGNKPNNL